MGKYVSKSPGESFRPGEGGRPEEDPIRGRFPALVEYLTMDKWEDGAPRATSTLLILCEDGVWKGCVNDRDGGRSLWCSSGLFEALLERLEAGLCGEGGEWRKRPPEGKKGKR